MTLIDSDSRHDHGPLQDHRSRFATFMASPVRVGLLAIAAVLLVDAGGTDDGPGICVFRRCTGGYCPGCGMTRSARHVLRGEVSAAWRDHPWFVLGLAQIAAGAAVYAVLRRVGSTFDWSRAIVPLAVVNAAVIIAIWVVRLADGSIPRFF